MFVSWQFYLSFLLKCSSAKYIFGRNLKKKLPVVGYVIHIWYIVYMVPMVDFIYGDWTKLISKLIVSFRWYLQVGSICLPLSYTVNLTYNNIKYNIVLAYNILILVAPLLFNYKFLYACKRLWTKFICPKQSVIYVRFTVILVCY